MSAADRLAEAARAEVAQALESADRVSADIFEETAILRVALAAYADVRAAVQAVLDAADEDLDAWDACDDLPTRGQMKRMEDASEALRAAVRALRAARTEGDT